jgi:hypothetical protein
MRYSGPRRSFEINSKEIVGEKAVIVKDKNCKEIKLGRVYFSLFSHITNYANFGYSQNIKSWIYIAS